MLKLGRYWPWKTVSSHLNLLISSKVLPAFRHDLTDQIPLAVILKLKNCIHVVVLFQSKSQHVHACQLFWLTSRQINCVVQWDILIFNPSTRTNIIAIDFFFVILIIIMIPPGWTSRCFGYDADRKEYQIKQS